MLYMKKKDYEKVLEHCKAALPNEACGLIAGTRDGDKKQVEKGYLLNNIDQSSEHFSMDPKEQFAVVRDIRENGWELIGNFHSHPETPSRMSEEDKRLAYDLKLNYLILSLMNLENPVLNSFCIDEEKNVTQEECIII